MTAGVETGTDTHLDVSGEALLYNALSRYWHPVAYASSLASGGPIPAFLLGEALAIVRLGGEVKAFRDICAHRGTAISLGSVDGDQIRCAYHGWTYGPDGMCTEIPARFGASIPPRARLTSFDAVEASGLIWVCLSGEPRLPVPDFADFHNPSFRVIPVASYDWKSSASRRLENYVDFAHFAWVHDGILGDREHPEVPDHDVHRVEGELRFGEAEAYGEVPEDGVEGRSSSASGLPHKTGTILADKKYRVFLPFSVWLQQRLPGAKHYQLFTAVAPTGPATCRSFTFMARDYDLDESEDQKFVSFNDTIIGQDQPLVESQRPEQLPVDLSAEVQIRGADKVAVEYRRWLHEIAYEVPDTREETV